MHQFYSFDFFQTITDQLFDCLGKLSSTPLTPEALATLKEYEIEKNSVQGVYCLVYDGKTVYVGKADAIDERLGQHLAKISGRHNIDLSLLHYKAILLDKSMSTAANETLLIKSFKTQGECEWNGSGLGSKDPGGERDTTKPSKFDKKFPLRTDFRFDDLGESITLGELLLKMKEKLPFVFRWSLISPEQAQLTVDLHGVDCTAENLAKLAAHVLGTGWRAGTSGFGILLKHGDGKSPLMP